MKLLVDAQLPRRFCGWLTEAGHDAVHTLDLPQGTGQLITKFSTWPIRSSVSKDDDFVQSFLITGRPKSLLLASTGNISNERLEMIVRGPILEIVQAFESASFIGTGARPAYGA